MSQYVYLGHVVGSGIVQPEESKVKSVKSFPTPKTKKDIRTFLGLTGYYRKFIPDYASIAVPLTELTRKSASCIITWNAECEKAFQKLKNLLCCSPVLSCPDFKREFALQTDASEFGVAAVEYDKNNEDHPIAYFSRKLLPREQRYSTVEKECMAIKLEVQAFHVYLLGRPFIIQTDHCSLE